MSLRLAAVVPLLLGCTFTVRPVAADGAEPPNATPRPATASWQLTLVPYVGRVSYSGDAFQDHARYAGLQSSLASLRHSLLLGYEDLVIDYKTRGVADFTQDQTYLNYWWYPTHYLGLHLGGIHLGNADPATDGGRILSLGGKGFSLGRWEAGMVVRASDYPDYRAWQFTPHAGVAAGHVARRGRLYAELYATRIQAHHQRVGRIPFDSSYQSLGVDASYSRGAWTLRADVWEGSRLLAITEDGTIVYNSTVRYTGGQKLYLSRAFGSVGLSLSWENLGFQWGAPATASTARNTRLLLWWTRTGENGASQSR